MCPVVCSPLLPAAAGLGGLGVFASVAAQVSMAWLGPCCWLLRVVRSRPGRAVSAAVSLRAEGLDAPLFVAAGVAAGVGCYCVAAPFVWGSRCVCWVAWGCFFLPCGYFGMFAPVSYGVVWLSLGDRRQALYIGVNLGRALWER